MFVICNGMPRSASTWSFNVAVGLLRRADDAEHIYRAYDENIAQFLTSAPERARHLVLKCHSLDPVGRSLARSGAAKMIYTWRRLSDAVVSFMRMFNVDFEHAFAVTEDSLRLYAFHQRAANSVLLRYEDLVVRPLEAVDQIDRYLGLNSSRATLDAVCQQNSLDRMAEKVRDFSSAENQERLIKLERTSYDANTLLNVNHIRDGGIGYGSRSLSAAQLDRISALSREYGVEE